ncbi:MAG TPA: YbhB/YbcL family Raf kinase inhibitor-like protein [Candidatus Tectomicrobia bacterium]
MRGSWNRLPPSGYEVIRVSFSRDGTPERIEPFITGFLVKGATPEGRDGQFARLAGLAVMQDGSLLVSDDKNGVLYRIWHGQDQASKHRDSFPRVPTSQLPGMQGQARLTVTSRAFVNGGAIPQQHSAYGEDISPTLSWSGMPAAAQSVVVLVEDPDALSPKPFVHWSVANLPTQVTALPAGLPPGERLTQLGDASQGANHMSQLGWFGPKPPAGDPPHHYHFQVFGLDTTLTLPGGFNRQALLGAMRGHVLAFGQVVGTYERDQSESMAGGRQSAPAPGRTGGHVGGGRLPGAFRWRNASSSDKERLP